MEVRIIVTDDGSNTVYLPVLDETYHSKFGAVQEARHVFIQNGLANITKNEINVFELGFGTGLNTLLSAIYAKENNLRINYTTIEKYPLKKEIITELNYSTWIDGSKELFSKIHRVEWGIWHEITPWFRLQKIENDILNDDSFIPADIDLIYFDAFAPSKQEELWNEKLFQKLFDNFSEGGRLVTYSAAGVVKTVLRKVGFKVKRLPGPPGKHHMLIAYKTI